MFDWRRWTKEGIEGRLLVPMKFCMMLVSDALGVVAHKTRDASYLGGRCWLPTHASKPFRLPHSLASTQ